MTTTISTTPPTTNRRRFLRWGLVSIPVLSVIGRAVNDIDDHHDGTVSVSDLRTRAAGTDPTAHVIATNLARTDATTRAELDAVYALSTAAAAAKQTKEDDR